MNLAPRSARPGTSAADPGAALPASTNSMLSSLTAFGMYGGEPSACSLQLLVSVTTFTPFPLAPTAPKTAFLACMATSGTPGCVLLAR